MLIKRCNKVISWKHAPIYQKIISLCLFYKNAHIQIYKFDQVFYILISMKQSSEWLKWQTNDKPLKQAAICLASTWFGMVLGLVLLMCNIKVLLMHVAWLSSKIVAKCPWGAIKFHSEYIYNILYWLNMFHSYINGFGWCLVWVDSSIC